MWLDPAKTSPYKFFQFWLNSSDEDSKNYIRIFTTKSQEEVLALEAEHDLAPNQRLLQKAIAKEVTIRVHSESDYNAAVEASEILFGNAPTEALSKLDEETLLNVFEGVPQMQISRDELTSGISVIELLSDKTNVFPSRGEARKLIQGGGVSINKQKLTDVNAVQNTNGLLQNKYLLVQKGKKNYYLLIVSQ